jgi:Flp pilus assembly protein TadG
MVALMLVVLMAAVALAVDVGGLYLRRRELVNGADSAALAAARACLRGGLDVYGLTPEEAADAQAQANGAITASEVAGKDITYIPAQCGGKYGHVSVQYTSQQALHFAPVLGFNNSSPVTTTATASWGLGSVNSVPLIHSGQLWSNCPKPPPTGPNYIGQPQCGIWYDNDTLQNGNFGFLTLDPAGWDVPGGDVPADCSGSNPGSSTLGDWISGAVPTSVSLNWLEPTYVCSTGGLKGNSNPWVELEKLKGEVRDFPITWEGPGSPGYGALPQGYVFHSDAILKYDVIGFSAMEIVDVLTAKQAEPTSTVTPQDWTDYTYDAAGITLNSTLPAGASVSYTWNGHPRNGNGQPFVKACSFQTPQDTAAGTYTWQAFGGSGNQCPGNGDVVDAVSQVLITVPVTITTDGVCGPLPPGVNPNAQGNSSTRCVVVKWQGSTLTDDYPVLENVRVVRLCDPDPPVQNCLDQRPRLSP